MLRVVLDTNIYLRAFLNRYSLCGRLLYQYSPEYTIVVSQSIIFEVLSVVNRPKLQAKSPNLVHLDYETVMLRFDRAELVEPEDIPRVCRDPKDDKFLACAKAGQVEYLVTEDKDLLVLGDYEGTRIIQPVEFIKILEATTTSH